MKCPSVVVSFSHFHLLHWMELNLAGSIYVRSSIKFPHFVPIGQQTWPPQTIPVSDWLIFQNLLFCHHLAKWNQTIQEPSNKNQKLSKIFLSCLQNWMKSVFLPKFCQNFFKVTQNLWITMKIQSEICTKMQNIDPKSALTSQKQVRTRICSTSCHWHYLSCPHPRGMKQYNYKKFGRGDSSTHTFRKRETVVHCNRSHWIFNKCIQWNLSKPNPE